MKRRAVLVIGLFVLVVGSVEASRAEAQESADSSVDRVTLRPGDGLRVRSEDGRYGVGISALLQLWGTADEATDDVVFGAQVRRVRVGITGHVFGEDNRLTLSVGTPGDERLDGIPDPERDFGVVDAFIGFHQLRDFEVRVGRQLVPLLRSWISPAAALATPERSRAARRWHRGRRLGISFGSDDFLGVGRIRYRAGAFLGDLGAGPLPLGLVGRIDVSILGNVNLNVEGDLSRSPTPRLSLGGGYMFLLNELPFGDAVDQQDATVDLIFRTYGLSLEGTFLWTKTAAVNGQDARSDLGGTAMASYLLPWFNLEASVRYSGTTTGIADMEFLEHQWTGALSYYFAGDHNFKLQGAVMHNHVGDADGFFSGIFSLQANL
ncbi:MAG: phosphate-selective porin OprO/OprP [Polyangiales bacterium]